MYNCTNDRWKLQWSPELRFGEGSFAKRKLWDRLPKLLSPGLSVTDSISHQHNDLHVVLVYFARRPIQGLVRAGSRNSYRAYFK